MEAWVGTIIYNLGIFQHAMFDCQRVTGFGSTKMLDIMGYPEKKMPVWCAVIPASLVGGLNIFGTRYGWWCWRLGDMDGGMIGWHTWFWGSRLFRQTHGLVDWIRITQMWIGTFQVSMAWGWHCSKFLVVFCHWNKSLFSNQSWIQVCHTFWGRIRLLVGYVPKFCPWAPSTLAG